MLARFSEGPNCTQAIAATYGPNLGLDVEQALKGGDAFGSGMGMGATCGALTGALMIIGLKHAKLHDIKFIPGTKRMSLLRCSCRNLKPGTK